MKKLDRFSSLFWIGLSIAVCIRSYDLGLGSFHNPGPGFLFFWTAIVLGGLSVLILLQSLRSGPEVPKEGEGYAFQNVHWIKIVSIIFSILLYGFFLERLGFLLSTVLLIAFLLRSIEAKKWYVVILVSVASALSSYVLFELLLQSRLPAGFLGF